MYAAGRIVHLQPMRWVDDWPIIGEISDTEIANGEVAGKPVASYRKPGVGVTYEPVSPDASDDFTSDKLGLQWQWNANPKSGWYELKDGALMLNAVQKDVDSISNVSNLLLQKWCMPEFCAETKLILSDMKTDDTAGMISMGITYGAVAVEKTDKNITLKTISGTQVFDKESATAIDKEEIIADLPLDTREIYFRNVVKKVPSTKYNSDGPYTFLIPEEEISLCYSLDGRTYTEVLSYPSQAGRWVGVKNGVFCCHTGDSDIGKVIVSYFRFI